MTDVEKVMKLMQINRDLRVLHENGSQFIGSTHVAGICVRTLEEERRQLIFELDDR